jgi:hypothetical protein
LRGALLLGGRSWRAGDDLMKARRVRGRGGFGKRFFWWASGRAGGKGTGDEERGV